MMYFLKKAWIHVKSYWKYFFIGALFLAALFFFRSSDKKKYSDMLAESIKDHRKQVDALNAALATERQQRAESEKRLRETLEAVQKQYEEAKLELSKQKKKEIEKIVKQYQDDLPGLANRLSEATGFRVILPKEFE